MGEPRRRRRRPASPSSNSGSGEDRISGLPDELLHKILVRLRYAQDAARTSVLSRRWRNVWAHLPQLRLFARDRDRAAPASFMASVDAALGGYLAPNLEYLAISISTKQQDRASPALEHLAPAGRIARWLHFAAEHGVGELYLHLLGPWTRQEGHVALLELPVCEGAKQLVFFLDYERATWIRPKASGLFKALTYLHISGHSIRMEGGDITALVNTQCPCLRELRLSIELIVNFDISIHSNSLRTLELGVLETRRLEIVAPELDGITVIIKPIEAHISTPKLVKVAWHGAYDPDLHRFVDVGRTLQLLQTLNPASSLTKRFDEVDVLVMRINIDSGTYGRFLNETNELPKCKRFYVFLMWDYHALVPIMLQLFRSSNCTKMFRVELVGDESWSKEKHSCLPPCPCRLEESHKIDGIDLSSLEEVEIIGFSGSHQQMELVEFISSNAGILKRLVIFDNFCHRPKEACAKIRSMCHPNVRVELYGFCD